MKLLGKWIVLGVLMVACQKSEVVSEFTGNETTYALQPGSQFAISGTVTFREKKDGQIDAVIQLGGLDGDRKFPVHLHLGDISKPGADIALLMTPVAGKTGTSETIFNKLSDESSITYQQLIQLQACVKIHLGDAGADRDVVLAAGNIGSAVIKPISGGRTGVAVCKSE